MFKANRVGTPKFLGDTFQSDTTAFTINTGAMNAAPNGNVINAAALGDFGTAFVRWNAAARVIPTLQRWVCGAQITITEPLQGDAVGIELAMDFKSDLPNTVNIYPIFYKLNPAPVTLWGAAPGAGGLQSVALGPGRLSAPGQAESFLGQVVIEGATVAGTYMAGFACHNPTGAGVNVSQIECQVASRQLNDQQFVSYRDTRF
jgi:hypothetical protein